MSFDLADLTRAVALHGRVARVVIADVKGSAPREAGAAMLVWDGGQSGTIGGGALEYQAARDALTGPWARPVPLGPALGQCCGGSVTLVCEMFDPETLPGDAPYVRRIADDMSYVRRITGSAPEPLAIHRAAAQSRNVIALPVPCFADGWLCEPLTAPVTPLWIYGAGHVGRALIHTLAPLPDLAITWLDTSVERFPPTLPDTVTRLPDADPVRMVRFAPGSAHHLILTYSHALDLALCHALLSHGFASAGLIGSTTKWARFRTRLRAFGHSDAGISRMNCPIGDPKLGKHPHAIAVGVAQDLLSSLNATGLAQAAIQSDRSG